MRINLKFNSFRFIFYASFCLYTFFLAFIFKSFGHQISNSKKILDLGPRVQLQSYWTGKSEINQSIPVLILAGHADSQNLQGAGTSGAAVDLDGLIPMDQEISDELYWNLKISQAIVRLGKEQGLTIDFYDPLDRDIADANNPNTNWSVGALHASQGGYALEIHFDSYGEYGIGSGLIPALTNNLNSIDESLANSFGRYPILFRGGLGAPRRGIRILEIGKLEGNLERSLRNPIYRDSTIKAIAEKVVQAFLDARL